MPINNDMPITAMKFEVKADSGAKTYQCRSYNFHSTQSVNPMTGTPNDSPVMDLIEISVWRNAGPDDPTLPGWHAAHDKQYDAGIVFFNHDQRVRSHDFTNVYLVGYQQSSASPGDVYETLWLSPISATLDTVKFIRRASS